jgi:hypothetical protein
MSHNMHMTTVVAGIPNCTTGNRQSMQHMKILVPLLLVALLDGAFASADNSDAGVSTSRKLLAPTTRLTYSSDAARMAAIWVNPADFEILGGARAPKFTGSAISSAIIQWASTESHSLARPLGYQESAVLTTGDAMRAISKAKYTGERAPTHPDITNKNIRVRVMAAIIAIV